VLLSTAHSTTPRWSQTRQTLFRPGLGCYVQCSWRLSQELEYVQHQRELDDEEDADTAPIMPAKVIEFTTSPASIRPDGSVADSSLQNDFYYCDKHQKSSSHHHHHHEKPPSTAHPPYDHNEEEDYHHRHHPKYLESPIAPSYDDQCGFLLRSRSDIFTAGREGSLIPATTIRGTPQATEQQAGANPRPEWSDPLAAGPMKPDARMWSQASKKAF
jgi:hypothetical protein